MAAKKNPLADKAYELYKDGMKLVDIADQLGKPEGTIRRWKNTYDWDSERSDCKANENEHPKRTKDKKNGKKLTPKQEAFAAEYIKNGGNATRAAKDAGYAEARAAITGSENVRKSNISESIAEQMERIEKEQHRDIMSLAEIQERRSMIAKGMLRDGEGYTPEFKDQLKAMDGLEKALTIAEKQRIEREEKEKREKAPLWTIPITDITSDFVEIYRTVHEAFAGEIDVHEIVSKGGRGSIKSNFWGDLAYETIRQDPQAHIVYTRRYKVDLRGSVYNQFMKTVIRYNDLDNWDFKQSPMCAVYKPTGQMVMFVGADKPISLKSFNVPFGYVKMLIHEECDEMAGVEQMDNIEDTFLRSDTPALDIKIFNPPKSKNNFMNQYVEECKTKPQTRICHSYYYNVPVKWLGKRFFERAEWFKAHKPLYYRNNYIGEVTGTGGGIFDNVEERTITDAEIENMPFFIMVWTLDLSTRKHSRLPTMTKTQIHCIACRRYLPSGARTAHLPERLRNTLQKRSYVTRRARMPLQSCRIGDLMRSVPKSVGVPAREGIIAGNGCSRPQRLWLIRNDARTLRMSLQPWSMSSWQTVAFRMLIQNWTRTA